MVVLKNAERDFLEQELQLLNDKRELKSKISEKEESHLCQLRMQIIVCLYNFYINFKLRYI